MNLQFHPAILNPKVPRETASRAETYFQFQKDITRQNPYAHSEWLLRDLDETPAASRKTREYAFETHSVSNGYPTIGNVISLIVISIGFLAILPILMNVLSTAGTITSSTNPQNITAPIMQSVLGIFPIVIIMSILLMFTTSISRRY